MTQAEFTAFYPQFAGFTPAVVLTEYIRQANKRFSAFSPEDAEEARRLYTAHKLTMYARMALPDGTTPSKSAIAAAGQMQRVSSKKVGGGLRDVYVRGFLFFCIRPDGSGGSARNGFRDAAAIADQVVCAAGLCAVNETKNQCSALIMADASMAPSTAAAIMEIIIAVFSFILPIFGRHVLPAPHIDTQPMERMAARLLTNHSPGVTFHGSDPEND